MFQYINHICGGSRIKYIRQVRIKYIKIQKKYMENKTCSQLSLLALTLSNSIIIFTGMIPNGHGNSTEKINTTVQKS